MTEFLDEAFGFAASMSVFFAVCAVWCLLAKIPGVAEIGMRIMK